MTVTNAIFQMSHIYILVSGQHSLVLSTQKRVIMAKKKSIGLIAADRKYCVSRDSFKRPRKQSHTARNDLECSSNHNVFLENNAHIHRQVKSYLCFCCTHGCWCFLIPNANAEVNQKTGGLRDPKPRNSNISPEQMNSFSRQQFLQHGAKSGGLAV